MTDVQRHAWVEPGAFEVADRVYRIPLPLPTDGLRAVNVYAVSHDDGLMLIDAGWALEVSERRLVESLASIGYELGDITRICVTHAHRDHYTQAHAIRRALDRTGRSQQPRIALGWDERDSIRSIAFRAAHPADAGAFAQVGLLRRAGDPQAAKALEAIVPEGLRAADWADPDDWLRDGDRVLVGHRTLEVIATPGHTRGHVVFADDEHGLLFAGDHVLPHITPSIGYEEVLAPSPLGSYLKSLQLIRSRPDARLLPAHGPADATVHERVDELLAHHQIRLDASIAAVEAGASTALEVAGRLLWTRRGTRLEDLDGFNHMMAVLETWAHLMVAAERGLVTSRVEQGVEHFTVPEAAIRSGQVDRT
jgi:glyoxylase-like metal-dependent hydrolase (beta-lactamase superfamily II)